MNKETQLEMVARLLRHHDLIQGYSSPPGLHDLLQVTSEGWPGYLRLWDMGTSYRMLEFCSIPRTDISMSEQVWQLVNGLNQRAITYHAGLVVAARGTGSLFFRGNLPLELLLESSQHQKWALLATYSVLHMGDYVTDELESLAGRPATEQTVWELSLSL